MNDSGCYSFLAPFLDELALHTGRRIDLQHDCRFSGSHVTDLLKMTTEALAAARTKPSVFEVELAESAEDILITVDRDALISLLTSLEELAATAQKEHLAILSEGEYTLRQKGILTDDQKQRRLRAADAAERYLEGHLSWSEFNDEIDNDGDPLIEQLEYEEHVIDDYVRDAMQGIIEKLRRSG